MAYSMDLSGAWRKLQRGKHHIDSLRFEVLKAGYPDPYTIPVRREYDADDRAVVIRVERVIEIADDWSAIVGDAVHNIRAALNHLAWQLALKHYNGSIPNSRSVGYQIQFPIVSGKSKWADHPHRKHMDAADAEILEPYEPFQPRPVGVLHPLEGLALLNDIDKHRTLHLLYVVTRHWDVMLPIPPSALVDCEVDTTRLGPGSGGLHGYDFAYFGARPPKPDDEVMRIYVRPTGPNPDAQVDVRLTGGVAIREGWDLLESLNNMAMYVGPILAAFGGVPDGYSLAPEFVGPETAAMKERRLQDARPPDFLLQPGEPPTT